MATETTDRGFAFHVHQFMPDCEGEELELRITLLKAREFAGELRCTTISEFARNHAIDAQSAADHFLYCPSATPSKLGDAVQYCRLCVQCAYLAENLDPEAWQWM